MKGDLTFKKIYIPLCLYFNSESGENVSVTAEFTFHYVSILIRRYRGINLQAIQFTFHYVSILIRFLHFLKNRNIKIYIPLCLYFNPSSPSLFIFFLFHPLSVDLSIAINILPYFSCFFYKIDGKCPIYRVF